ncbi:DUF2784 domain-containing protein [Acidocella sp.]|uniref:DUF2784 domain-containing protein n=1 Tax=Acidocella sp. TaxID=50710 RepID=UPI00262CD2BB|nr:DUF2784 domain-containing protein [Acidocella sp.]
MPEIKVADAVLGLHLIIIAFNIVGLVIIPIGAWLDWRIVRVAWLRLLHLIILAIVAGQALAGRVCFLTEWQNKLAESAQQPKPLLMHWINEVIYWNLPMWIFSVMYCLAFFYVLALTALVPFRWPGLGRSGNV